MQSPPNKWCDLLSEIDPSYSQQLYSVVISVAISKSRGGDITETQAEIRGIDGVTTVSDLEGGDREDQYNYYRRYRIKFVLTRTQDIDAYLGAYFIPGLREIKGLHKIKVITKPQEVSENKNAFADKWRTFLQEASIRDALWQLLNEKGD